jgi:hypothetical protein
MSDTPRTDAAVYHDGSGDQWPEVVPAEFARVLERELNALRPSRNSTNFTCAAMLHNYAGAKTIKCGTPLKDEGDKLACPHCGMKYIKPNNPGGA